MMNIGYIAGGLLSVLCYKIDRKQLWKKLNNRLSGKIKDKNVLTILYGILIILLAFLLRKASYSELINGIVAFLVIDIVFEGKVEKSTKIFEKKKWYNALSSISNSYICGFIAPLTYIIIFGNCGGIIYFLINLICEDDSFVIYNSLLSILNIIPSLLGCGVLFIVYALRNKTLKINLKGDFFKNLFEKPLININIIAAYIELVNFYYYEEVSGIHYIKSYGEYIGKIDEVTIDDYQSIIHGACFLLFVIFWIIIGKFGQII